MTKTVRIARPKFARNSKGPSGRVEHDARGNAIWTRTRAGDGADVPDISSITVAEEPLEANTLAKTAKRSDKRGR